MEESWRTGPGICISTRGVSVLGPTYRADLALDLDLGVNYDVRRQPLLSTDSGVSCGSNNLFEKLQSRRVEKCRQLYHRLLESRSEMADGSSVRVRAGSEHMPYLSFIARPRVRVLRRVLLLRCRLVVRIFITSGSCKMCAGRHPLYRCSVASP